MYLAKKNSLLVFYFKKKTKKKQTIKIKSKWRRGYFKKIQKLSSQNLNIDARSGCGHALWRSVASGRFYPVKTERWNRLDPRQLGQEFVIWRNDFVSSVHYDTANIPIRFDCNLELNWFHFSVLETKWIHHRCLSDRKLQMCAQLQC